MSVVYIHKLARNPQVSLNVNDKIVLKTKPESYGIDSMRAGRCAHLKSSCKLIPNNCETFSDS